jgi:ribonucleoside-triphosphate reductase
MDSHERDKESLNMEREENARLEELCAIDMEIASLDRQLAEASGTKAEVYSRIVGYYRSVKNWNNGKREEYGERVLFDAAAEADPLERSTVNVNIDSVHIDAQDSCPSHETIQAIVLLSRDRCPNCPPVRKALLEAEVDFDELSADTLEGMAFASRYDILSTPTLICLDDSESEVMRCTTALQIKEFFLRQPVFA